MIKGPRWREECLAANPELARLVTDNLPTILAALRASRPEAAADAVEGLRVELTRRLWAVGDISNADAYREAVHQLGLLVACNSAAFQAALAALPRPAVDEGAVERAAVVSWLLTEADGWQGAKFNNWAIACRGAAEAIERGDHRSAALAAAQEGSK